MGNFIMTLLLSFYIVYLLNTNEINYFNVMNVLFLFVGKHRPKMTLDFDSGGGGNLGSSKGLHLNLGPLVPPRDLVDASMPLDRQRYEYFMMATLTFKAIIYH